VWARRGTAGHHSFDVQIKLTSLAHGAGCGCKLPAASVAPAPVAAAIEGVPELLRGHEEDVVSGGTRRNRAFAETFTTFDDSVPEWLRWLVCDAMTSGGLLAALPPDRAGAMPGAVIGRLLSGPAGAIAVE
jgi:selenide,water dikinase